MKPLFYIGISLILTGIILESVLPGSLPSSISLFIGILVGIVLLVMHLVSIFRYGSAHIGFKLLLAWFLVAFSIFAGYLLTIICLVKKKPNIVEVFETGRTSA
ncbi:hypothetical protein [Aliikangiella sp. G2MR2-5]|uniref:hypothetical protein n=1 Tax=Aliikangiella sp. G2MR2-5 TaxID=2788943 RepID=UPI0018AA1E25|nr:hypothetical protein [Aliikangiella sp. G2MR2-5]